MSRIGVSGDGWPHIRRLPWFLVHHLARSEPAGHAQHRPGRVGGGVGEEPGDGFGRFLGLAQARHENAGDGAGRVYRFAGRGVDVGVGRAGRHGVDADPLRG